MPKKPTKPKPTPNIEHSLADLAVSLKRIADALEAGAKVAKSATAKSRIV